LDAYFSASKLKWILDHVPAAKMLLARGKLRLGTIDSFFLDRLAGVYATDVTTASRTSLMNLRTGQWDPELCRLFGVPIECLAGIYNAASAVNWARGLGLFSELAEIDDFAAAPAIERGLVFVPALSGLAAPHWDRNAAGLWLGMGLETTPKDMTQALLEGIALLSSELIVAIDRATPLSGNISIDGGLSRNSYFCD